MRHGRPVRPIAAATLSCCRSREVYIDAELEPVDTVQWYPKVMRKDFTVGLSVTEAGVDDPDQQFYENYACGAERAESTGPICDRL